jgi:hypothetical protein
MIRRGFVVAVAVLSEPAAGFSPAALPALRRAGARVSSSASTSRNYMTVMSPQAARTERTFASAGPPMTSGPSLLQAADSNQRRKVLGTAAATAFGVAAGLSLPFR